MSTRVLMARMGHDDMRAALIYQRATDEAAERIADGLTDLVRKHRGGGKKKAGKKRGKSKRQDPETGTAGTG